MVPRIKNVRYLRDYRLELTFTDGKRAEKDFRSRIIGRGGIFVALEDIDYFRKVSVDLEARTLVWPNGVDFCPDVLYCEATGRPLPVNQPVHM